jgi:hypothetical protein
MVAKLLVRANRKKLSDQTIKELYALTGNECAKCNIKLVYTEIHAVRGIICHIEAASRRGPRYNAQQSDDHRHSYSNLIVLCPNCHDEIDKNPKKYTVDYLLSLKKEHEARFKDHPYQIPDDIIKIIKISVNQDEFSLNDITRLFMIFFRLKNHEAQKYFFENRINYSLNNASLTTIESDSTTRSELDDVFNLMKKLPDKGFYDCFVALSNKIPLHILKEYVDKNKRRLRLIISKDNMLAGPIYWLVYEQNEGSLNKLINSAADYDPHVFVGLINDFDFGRFDNEKKTDIEQRIWKKLDKEKERESNEYRNLSELDTKLFNSLQPKGKQ